MAGIATTLRLVDQMTAPIMAINNAINLMTDRFNTLEQATDVDAASLTGMRNQINLANQAAEMVNQTFADTLQNIEACTGGQDKFNNNIRQGGSAADGLLGKIGATVAAYASIQAVKNVLGLSDELTNITARLNMMNDGLRTTEELQNKIYLSAQRSYTGYQMTADVVSKLGTQAGQAFNNNDELIEFAEQLNKSFSIAGTSASGVESVMYNLTQALSSGVLRGQDLNSVFSNAPNIIQNIADYMDVPLGQIRDMAADGQLSAEIVKNAMLAAADETNAAFEQMPMTFGQIATSIKNQAIMAFQPILTRINEIGNSPAFQSFVDNAVNAFTTLANVATTAIDGVIWAVNLLQVPLSVITDWVTRLYENFVNNWSRIAPIVGFVASALLGVAAAVAAYTAVTQIAAAVQWVMNSALLACPLTWIIIAIMAIIAEVYFVISVVNRAANTSVSATGVIFGAFAWVGAFLWDLFLGLLELVLGVLQRFINPFITTANFIGNVFNSPVSSVIYLFQTMADEVLKILQKLAAAMDAVFGSNLAGAVGGWRDGLKGKADILVSKYAPNENYQKVMDELDLSIGTFGLKRLDLTDAYGAGYDAGVKFEETIGNFDPASLFNGTSNIPTADDYGGYGGGFTDYNDLMNGVNNIDNNTKGQLDYSEEEIKLWRDIAERDAINRFTTAEVNVEMGGVTNNVASEMDLDGVINYLADGLEEALYEVAGVYS